MTNVLSVKVLGCLLCWNWQTVDLSSVEVGHLVVSWRTCKGNAQKTKKTVNFVSPEFLNLFLLFSLFYPNICASYLSKINHRWQDVGLLSTSESCSTILPNSMSRNFQSVFNLCGFHDFTATCPNKDAGCPRLRMNLQINLTLAASCCKQMPPFRNLLWIHS